MIRALLMAMGLGLSLQAHAFTCYLTLVKDSCWKNYTVHVDVIDANVDKVLTSISVPAGKVWNRIEFECQPSLKMLYAATFSPIFWESDKGKKFYAKRYWTLPDAPKPNESAWDIRVCYPERFSEVPFPPDAIGNCTCDYTDIPDVAPKIIQPN